MRENVFKAYRTLFEILLAEAPLLVVLVFLAAVANGVVNFVTVWGEG